MGVYQTTTFQDGIGVTCTYCCSKCGAINTSEQVIRIQSAYSNKNASRGEVDKRRWEALMALDAETEKMIEQAKDTKDVKKYYRYNLTGKCSKCQNIEPWADMKSNLLEKLINVFMIISVVAILVYGFLLINHISITPIPFIAVWAATLILFAVKYVRKKTREDRISKLPTESLPTLTFHTSKEERVEKMKEAYNKR